MQAVFVKKSLRFHKFPDTCGHGLSYVWVTSFQAGKKVLRALIGQGRGQWGCSVPAVLSSLIIIIYLFIQGHPI